MKALSPQAQARTQAGARWLLAGVFLLAGVLKGMDLPGFAAAVAHYGLTGPAATRVAALYLPWLEMVAAVALLTPAGRSGGWLVLTGLLAAFTALNLYAWAAGLPPDCGCFGQWDQLGRSHPGLLGRNLLLLGLAGWARPRGRESSQVNKFSS